MKRIQMHGYMFRRHLNKKICVCRPVCTEQKAFTKHFCIKINSLLNWKPHTENSTSSISISVRILYKLKDNASKFILKMIYQALIKSRLQYSILLCGNSNKSNLDRLNKNHNRALRYVTDLRYRTSIARLFKIAAVLQINYYYYLFISDTSGLHKQHEARSIVNTNTHKKRISINNGQQARPKGNY